MSIFEWKHERKYTVDSSRGKMIFLQSSADTKESTPLAQMIEFFSPILEHFCPYLYKLPRWVSFFPRWGLILPRIPSQPLFFTQPSQTSFRDMYLHTTPPSPPQNKPFPGLNLKAGKMNYCLCNLDPKWANVWKQWKVGKTFLDVSKKIIHLAQESPLVGLAAWW